MRQWMRRYLCMPGAALLIAVAALLQIPVTAQAAEGEFYLQVSPSPLVVTIKPGQTESYDIKIRNVGPQMEKLTIAPRSFSIDGATGKVILDDAKAPPDISDWLRFSQPHFSVQSGEWFTQKVTLTVPKEAGFSYSFALVIKRDETPTAASGTRQIKGSVAIFALINIDKPGATRVLRLDGVTTDKPVYEYLPATVNIKLSNIGNSIVRPSGTVFMQRGSNDTQPISAVPLNSGEGYILPGSTRTLAVEWADGFPGTRTVTDDGGQSRHEQDWSGFDLTKLRIGRYTAKVVAVYSDGQHDVPVVGEVGFWVIPWKILLVALVVVGIIGVGLWSIISMLMRRARRRSGKVAFKK